MTNKQKAGILVRFVFQWLLPRAVALALIAWLVYSVAEIGFADCTQIGRDYWEYNIIGLLMKL